MIKDRRLIIALLTALNLVNYIDRYLVMAVGPTFQKPEHLNLSNKELALVETAFMVGYMLTSPIFGWLGDRYRRKGLIAAGVAIWSVATVVSGMTHGLASMLAARVAVGVGEASYATLSPTIIDDVATKEEKNRLLAIFYAAIPVGAALGYVLGGILEPRFGWRSAFFIAGGPGVLLAALTLAIQEPARTTLAPAKSGGKGVYGALWSNQQYRYVVLGYIAQTFALGGFAAFAAPFLEQKLCLELAQGNKIFGYILAGGGLGGTAIGGLIADRVRDTDRTRAALKVCAVSSAIAAPFALGALLIPSSTSFLVALGVTEVVIFASVSPTNAAILTSVPASVRANAMAASIFAIHLLGDLLSPNVIGAVSDAMGDTHEACKGCPGLQLAMYLLPLALAASAFFWWRGVRSPSVAEVET